MIILQICAYNASYKGNFIESLERLEENLRNQKHQVIYVFPEPAKKLEWCKILSQKNKVYFLPLRFARLRLKTYLLLLNIFLNNKISIIHCHFQLYDLPTKIVKPKKIPLIWHLHNSLENNVNIKNKVFNYLQYYLFKKGTYVITLSKYHKKYLNMYGYPKAKINIIPNGIKFFENKNKNAYKNVDFLAFCWDFYKKGADLILDSGFRLSKEGFNFKIMINGNKKTWKDINLFCGNSIPNWLTLSNPTNNVEFLYDQAKVFIQASSAETFSFSTCEAISKGLIVLSSNIPGLKWAKECSSVIYFESRDKEQLYILMKMFLQNKLKINNNCLNDSLKIVQRKYSISRWIKSILNLYSFILNNES